MFKLKVGPPPPRKQKYVYKFLHRAFFKEYDKYSENMIIHNQKYGTYNRMKKMYKNGLDKNEHMLEDDELYLCP